MAANGIMTKVLSGSTIAVIIGAISFIGKGVVDNDVRNTSQHIEIRREMVDGDKDLREHIAAVKDVVLDIRLEQRELGAFIKSRL